MIGDRADERRCALERIQAAHPPVAGRACARKLACIVEPERMVVEEA